MQCPSSSETLSPNIGTDEVKAKSAMVYRYTYYHNLDYDTIVDWVRSVTVRSVMFYRGTLRKVRFGR